MKLKLPMDYVEAVRILKEGIAKENLSDIVSVKPTADELTVKVSKLGTSTFSFSVLEQHDSTSFTLIKEDIAFTHRGYKPKIIKAVKDMVIQNGGEVID